ncbi:MAG TPA: hypothetical protein VMB03_01630 [Bryobacteraceae bacterium]|nr:hypothetical protein [Bryobacteraceae bacterium]
MATTATSNEELISVLKQWQGLENATITHTTEVIGKTKNPLIQLLMEIIRQDSQMHYRVQQVLLDGLEKQSFTLTPDELGDIWDMIVKHDEMEKHTIELAEKALSRCRLFVQRHLLTYLIEDEKKHDRLLMQLEDFKKHIYPYA